MIELIPAIDIIDGKCVRLSQGDYNTRKVYNENPVEVAKEFGAHAFNHFSYNYQKTAGYIASWICALFSSFFRGFAFRF